MNTPHEPTLDVRTGWGEQKRQRSLSLTDACWQLLTDQASVEGTNRSDLIERWARAAQISSSSAIKANRSRQSGSI
jgi:hypothetical protein